MSLAIRLVLLLLVVPCSEARRLSRSEGAGARMSAAPRELRAAARAAAAQAGALRRAASAASAAGGARGAAARAAGALLADALGGCAAAFPELAQELAGETGWPGAAAGPHGASAEAAVLPRAVLEADLAAAMRASALVLDDALWSGAGASGSADAAFEQWFLGRATSALGDQLDAVRKEETFSGNERDMQSLLTSLKVGMGAPTFDALCSAVVAGGTAQRL
jgi:hypothetical protein